MRGVAFVALLGSLSASAATVDIPLDFGADFAAKTSSVRRVKMDGLAPGADFEAWFETDLPVDAHWFGTYLRKDGDRFSLRQSRHFSPAQWKSSPGRREGLVRVSYFGKVPAAGRLDLAFVCDHGRNFMRPTEDDMRALGHGMAMVSTQVDEAAQHFYRALGYRDAGGFVPDVPGYEQPMELIMVKDLRAAVRAVSGS